VIRLLFFPIQATVVVKVWVVGHELFMSNSLSTTEKSCDSLLITKQQIDVFDKEGTSITYIIQ
jgi:hypothetical protein